MKTSYDFFKLRLEPETPEDRKFIMALFMAINHDSGIMPNMMNDEGVPELYAIDLAGDYLRDDSNWE
jgi:hypothetical protein